MSIQQRQKHISMVNKTEVVDYMHDASISPVRSTLDLSLSVSCEDAAKHVSFPLKYLEGIWGKATQLLNLDGAIVPAPGQKPEARMVLSYSGKIPKGGAFSRSRKASVTRVQMNIHGGSITESQSFDQSTSYHTALSHPTPVNVSCSVLYMDINHYLALHFPTDTLLRICMGNLHICIHHCYPLNLCRHCRHLH